MFDYLPLRPGPSARNPPAAGGPPGRLVLLGLSTCAFCRRAKNFLETEGVPFFWINLDETDPELKKRAKADFKARFGGALTFPALIIGEDDFLPGFIEPSWRKELLT